MDYKQLVQDVYDGNEDPLKAFAIIDTLMKELKQCHEALKQAALEEASRYEVSSFGYEGYDFTRRAGGKRYDFSNIEEWKQKKEELQEIERKYKAACQARKLTFHAVTEDGELLELPKITYAKDSLSVKKQL